ncbi:hypothetical protein [Hyphomicrobium sp.]|nr:hypothetical protein [Hyphomicrobium sp.]MBY0560052.1 hypothetical protein [Hyphomicrobium sp.]
MNRKSQKKLSRLMNDLFAPDRVRESGMQASIDRMLAAKKAKEQAAAGN